MSIYSKESLALYIAILEFAHFLWETSKPTIVLTDNKSVTRFFQNNSYSTVLVERMRLCVAVNFFQNSTYRWLS